MPMKTREEILSYEDEELLNYYDECIEVFTEYNSKWNKMIKLKNKRLMKDIPIICLVTILIASVFSMIICVHSMLLTYSPMPESDGSWIYERLQKKYASEEDYQIEMADERKRYVSSLVATISITVGLVILVLGLKRLLGSQMTKAFNEFDTYCSNLY